MAVKLKDSTDPLYQYSGIELEKRFASILISLATSLLFLTLFHVSVKADFMVIRVPADYSSIQLAINAATPGSMILVSNGIYYENLVVNKALTLLGQDKTATILDGNETGNAVYVNANGVVINGLTIRNGERGIYLVHSNDSVISNNILLSNGESGVYLSESYTNIIEDNLVLRNGISLPGFWLGWGIVLTSSNNNMIDNNILSGNVVTGIVISSSSNNSIVNNEIENSSYGMVFDGTSQNNTIHHNNFIWIGNHVDGGGLSLNIWDDGAVGNYWDDYGGLDDGSDGRIAHDGIGDTALPHLGVDYYPLTVPLEPIPIVWENTVYPVKLLSNSTVSTFRFEQTETIITFNVRGPPVTKGYFNITIPKSLLRGNPWQIRLNGTYFLYPRAIITENQTHTTISVTYDQGKYYVQIIGTWVIPEFPSTIIPLIVLMFTTIAITIRRKHICKRARNHASDAC